MATSPNYAQKIWNGRNPGAPQSKTFAADPDAGAILKLGFALLVLDTFLGTSRFLEIVELDFGLALPYVVTSIHVLAFGLAFLTGGLRRIATTRTGIFLMLYTGWMMACIPLSTWRTGSVQTLLYFWTPALMAFLASGLMSSVRRCRQIAATLALSGLTIAVTSLLLASFRAQRFSFNAGTLGNANDLSMLLLMAAPFFLIPLFDPATQGVQKLLSSIGGLLVLIVNFRTGSRAGLVALLVILLVLFLTRSFLGKLKLAIASIVSALLLIAFIPSYSLYRYTTIFSEPDLTQDIRSDETYVSSMLRKELLQESLKVTLKHPLFGVGPGVYAPAMAKEAARQGKYANWLVSHNTYTQVSSEMGFPGLIFYLAAVICAFLDLLWARKHTRNNPSTNALTFGILLSLIGLNVNFFFSSNAYMAWMPILLGLSAALRSNLQRELGQQSSLPKPATARPLPSTPAAEPKPVYTYRFLGRPPRVRR